MLFNTEKQNSKLFEIINMLVRVCPAALPPVTLLSVKYDPELLFTEETAQFSHPTLLKNKSNIKEFHLV